MTKHEREVERAKKILKEKYLQKHIAKLMGKNKDCWNRIQNGKAEFKPEYIKELKRLKLI